MPRIIALHGDLANGETLRRDVGDLRNAIDLFFDGRGWLRFNYQYERLIATLSHIDEPLTLIGYSRGGSVIAKLSLEPGLTIDAAVLYEAPIIDSAGVGRSFPVLMIWNNQGVKQSPHRSHEAYLSEATWKASHPVTMLEGKGGHMRRKPLGHGWDTGLNEKIRDWLQEKTS